MEFTTYFWHLGIIGIISGIIGGIFFILSLSKMKGELRNSLLYLVVSSIIYLIFSSLMIILGVLKVEITHKAWSIVPVLFVINSIFYAIGSKKLIELLSKLSRD